METIDFDLVPKPVSILHRHPVETTGRLHPRKPAIRIRNFHFMPLTVHCFIPEHTAVFGQTNFSWHKAGTKELTRFQEGLQTALYALYVLNIPLGECIIQRDSVRDYRVYQVRPLKVEELTSAEKDKISRFREESCDRRPLTFGADAECLLQNRRTGTWVTASSVTAENKTIGYDDAIAVKGNKVAHPILELRPEPATDGKQLHRHLYNLYTKLRVHLRKNGLQVDTAGVGRFHAGGHLHVGNQPLTFKNVRNLDIFLTLPFAQVESGDPRVRRQRFGRLGSARPNSHSGFEYRSLASWVEQIPELLPMLEWFCYLNEHAEIFPTLDFSEDMIRGYYQHSTSDLRKVSDDIETICQYVLTPEDFIRFASPFFRLVHQKASML
jgi:hypothetical protein